MPSLPTLKCQGCGEVVTIPRRWSSVRKFCNLCQVNRECSFSAPPACNCERCGKTFFPIRKSWVKCADCVATFTLAQIEASANCNTCGRRRPPADGLEETCLDCIQSTDKHQEMYIRKVREIISERQVKNAGSVL